MPCKHYKDALIEAAASGSQPQGDLCAHLEACASCRAAFAQEQALFSMIDAGLHVTANAEVPASLLPRVRSRLDEESVRRRSWFTNWLVLASAAGVLVTLLTVRAIWYTNVVQKPVETAEKTSEAARVTPPPQNQNPVVAPPVEKNSASQRQLAIAKNPPAHETLAGGKTMPEVLVPRDQEILLAGYADVWRIHKSVPIFDPDSGATILAPLLVAPIQIAELDVKLLADERSQ
jgi:anti-sigma factor RsiW